MTLDPYVADGLATSIARLAPQRLSAVLHLDAGRGADLSVYRRLPIDHLVLVRSGDASLRGLDALPGWPTRTRAIDASVSGQGGRVTWHRYNLPQFDGPVAVDALVAHYPRLSRHDTTERETLSLGELVRGLPPSLAPGDRLLVLDAPGQGASLLRSLTDEERNSFGHVIVRICPPLDDDAATLRQAAPGHDLMAVDDLADPLHPVAWLRRDQAAAERDALAQQVKRLEQLHAALAVAHRSALDQAAKAGEAAEATRSALRDADRRGDETRAALVAVRAELAVVAHQAAAAADTLALERQQWQNEQARWADERTAAEQALREARARAAQAEQASDATRTERDAARSELEAQTHRADDADKTLARERQQWQGERARWTDERTGAEHALEEAQARATQALQDADAARTERDGVRAELEARIRRSVDAERVLTRERQQWQGEREALVARVDRLTAAADQLSADQAELNRRLASTDASHAEAKQTLEQLRLNSRREVADWQARVAWLERELNQARQGQMLATKLQLLRDNDLKDLQERYRELAQRQQSQRELLSKLAQRLTLAQEYFQQLPNWQGEDRE